MWIIASFEPTSLFSLRPANATTSGGKTLVTPTPYAIKMALLDAALRIYGQPVGSVWFPFIRDLQIAIALPNHLTVINTFVKILRPHKSGAKDTVGTGLEGPMGNTIAYRELVYFAGLVRIAIQPNHKVKKLTEIPPLLDLLAQIHYLGKRGGFMQFRQVEEAEELPERFTKLNRGSEEPFSIHGLMQLLDDCGPKMTFAHADVYDGKNISVGKPNGRILNPIILPYRLTKSSRAYSLYEYSGA
ncbi:MAG: hypothetical protein IPM53_20070 [Anaerolineaceae bacterium]|nr:hypothetical protein [Anaerolineaceae bacterium]